MDARQMALVLRHKLRAATWPDGTQELILGNRVYIAADGLEDEDIPAPPFALLHVGDFSADPKRPQLHEQQYNLVTVVNVMGDRLGEQAVIGGPRSGDILGSTLGRGVLDVTQGLLASVRELTGADGAPIIASLGSGSRARHVGENRHLAAQQAVIKGAVTADPSWPPVPWFTATRSGANTDLVWDLPGVPQGILQEVRIQYAAGSTPPATAGAGTNVYAGTGTSTSHTPAGFPASYSIWAAYSETGAAANEAFSSSRLWTGRTAS
jgi:hypothetical protein